jgi:hypothetical protein
VQGYGSRECECRRRKVVLRGRNPKKTREASVKNFLRILLGLGLVLPLLSCSMAEGVMKGALTAVQPATPLPVSTAVPPTETPVPPTSTPPIPVDVVISAVVNAGYAEHVVIKNRDTVVADLTGWHLKEKDNAILPFAFPAGLTLAPGAEVRIYSGRDGRQNNPPESFEWTELNIWDNEGDVATLLNSVGEPVSTFKYP